MLLRPILVSPQWHGSCAAIDKCSSTASRNILRAIVTERSFQGAKMKEREKPRAVRLEFICRKSGFTNDSWILKDSWSWIRTFKKHNLQGSVRSHCIKHHSPRLSVTRGNKDWRIAVCPLALRYSYSHNEVVRFHNWLCSTHLGTCLRMNLAGRSRQKQGHWEIHNILQSVEEGVICQSQ